MLRVSTTAAVVFRFSHLHLMMAEKQEALIPTEKVGACLSRRKRPFIVTGERGSSLHHFPNLRPEQYGRIFFRPVLFRLVWDTERWQHLPRSVALTREKRWLREISRRDHPTDASLSSSVTILYLYPRRREKKLSKFVRGGVSSYHPRVVSGIRYTVKNLLSSYSLNRVRFADLTKVERAIIFREALPLSLSLSLSFSLSRIGKLSVLGKKKNGRKPLLCELNVLCK